MKRTAETLVNFQTRAPFLCLHGLKEAQFINSITINKLSFFTGEI
ncbi:hypothetical protein QFZ87_004831 [Bacillus sp. SLBN-46]|nr:hypothetical protein [Bacillus sp. SLBN-46]MDR6125234.1 hypothetical protein [Bacillus sp. SLBN-46]